MADRSEYFQDYRKARGAATRRLIEAHPAEWETLLAEEREKMAAKRRKLARRGTSRVAKTSRATAA